MQRPDCGPSSQNELRALGRIALDFGRYTYAPCNADDLRPTDETVGHVMRMRREDLKLPGVAWAWGQGGQILGSGGDGFADVYAEREMTADTPIQIGSGTKLLTEIMVFKCIGRGLFELVTPIGDILHKGPEAGEWVRIPVVDLLGRTADLARTVGTSDAMLAPDRHQPLSQEVLFQALKSSSHADRMLVGWGDADIPIERLPLLPYSNTAYALLGLGTAKATEQPYPEFAKEVTQNLGWRLGGVMTAATPIDTLAVPYSSHQTRGWRRTAHQKPHPDVHVPSHGGFATIRELWMLLNAFLPGSPHLDAAALGVVHSVTPEAKLTLRTWGSCPALGVNVYERNGLLIIGKDGAVAGTRSAVLGDPRRGVCVALAANCSRPSLQQLGLDVMEMIAYAMDNNGAPSPATQSMLEKIGGPRMAESFTHVYGALGQTVREIEPYSGLTRQATVITNTGNSPFARVFPDPETYVDADGVGPLVATARGGVFDGTVTLHTRGEFEALTEEGADWALAQKLHRLGRASGHGAVTADAVAFLADTIRELSANVEVADATAALVDMLAAAPAAWCGALRRHPDTRWYLAEFLGRTGRLREMHHVGENARQSLAIALTETLGLHHREVRLGVGRWGANVIRHPPRDRERTQRPPGGINFEPAHTLWVAGRTICSDPVGTLGKVAQVLSSISAGGGDFRAELELCTLLQAAPTSWFLALWSRPDIAWQISSFIGAPGLDRLGRSTQVVANQLGQNLRHQNLRSGRWSPPAAPVQQGHGVLA